MEPFSEAHNIDIIGAKHIKSVDIYRTGELLVQSVYLVHKTLQYGDFM